MFTKQYGVRVTSTNRAGSQKVTGNPTRWYGGIGIGHVHKGARAFGVSSPEDETVIPPMVMGKRQDQQISVIGLTKRPVQVA